MHRPTCLALATILAAAGCSGTNRLDRSRSSMDDTMKRAALVTTATPSLPRSAKDPPLTADDAVAYALAHNPSFRSQLLVAHEAALAADIIELGPTPMLMLESGVPITAGASVPILALLSFSLSELVVRDDRLEAANLRAQAALLEAIDAAATLAAQVRTQHAMAWQAQEAQRLALLEQALMQAAADRLSALASSGLASVRDDQSAVAALAQSCAQLAQARGGCDSARRMLAMSLGAALEDHQWTLARPTLPQAPPPTLLAQGANTPSARMAIALSAAVEIDADLVRGGFAQQALLGGGFMQDEERMRAIPLTLQFALPMGGEGTTRDERADLMREGARLRADAALQAAHTRLADALAREAAAREAATAIEQDALQTERAQHDRIRVLAERGLATTAARDEAHIAAIKLEMQAIEAYAQACAASASRLAASAGLDLAVEPAHPGSSPSIAPAPTAKHHTHATLAQDHTP